MTASRHLIALLKSHIDGDDEHFLSVAMQVAAHEARQGHGKLAQELRDLVDEARQRSKDRGTCSPCPAKRRTGQPRVGQLFGHAVVEHGVACRS